MSHFARLDERIQYLHQTHRKLSYLRLAVFIIGGVGAFFSFQADFSGWGWSFLLLFGAIFFWAAHRHKHIERSLRRHRIWLQRKIQSQARLHLDWETLPKPSDFEVSPFHPFASDLNIAGHRSLHHFLDNTTTKGGSKMLLDWLLQEKPDVETALQRQESVALLQNQPLFREKLALLSLETDPKAGTKQHSGLRWDDQAVQKWLNAHQTPMSSNRWQLFLTIFACVNVALLWFALPFGILGIALYWLAYITQFPKLKHVFEEAQETQSVLQRFMPPLLYLENHRSSKLKDLLTPFQIPEKRPSLHSQNLGRIAFFSALTRNEFLFVLLNTLCPWEMIFTHLLIKAKAKLKAHLPTWLSHWYTIEAMNALAEYAESHPIATFPEFEPHQTKLIAHQAGHPLILETSKVRNDFEMQNVGEIALFTGSNMSGKSTFLRTIGTNIVLAFAGGKVDAASFLVSPLRVFSCMNVTDSVQDGLSYFYAEVKRLKALLDTTSLPNEAILFYLIDEIFRGTNNRERLLGSRAFIQALAQKEALGMISTHDLDLVQLENDLPHLHNYHFREDVQDNQMTFDYQLRNGACPTTNALKIMEIEGLPIIRKEL